MSATTIVGTPALTATVDDSGRYNKIHGFLFSPIGKIIVLVLLVIIFYFLATTATKILNHGSSLSATLYIIGYSLLVISGLMIFIRYDYFFTKKTCGIRST